MERIMLRASRASWDEVTAITWYSELYVTLNDLDFSIDYAVPKQEVVIESTLCRCYIAEKSKT